MTAHDRPDPNDPAWPAFRYVTGAMSAAEQDAFEHRLAHDLAACEAVAEVVELREVFARLDPPSSWSPRPERRLRPSLVRFAAAAVLLALVTGAGAWIARSSPRPHDPGHLSGRLPSPNSLKANDFEVPTEVALAWSQLRGSDNLDDGDAWAATLEGGVENFLADADDDGTEDPPLSSWLVELASLHDDTDTTREN